MRKTTFTLIVILGICCQATAQKPSKVVKKLGPNPVYVLDSIEVGQADLMKVNPSDIAIVNMFYEKEAIQLLGDKARDGIAYMETKKFARNRFVNFFKSYSPVYDSLLTANNTDSSFQYILNDRILEINYEGDLALIDKELITGLEVINSEQLKSKYKITDKSVGVLIKSRRPKDLYHGRKKF